MKQEPKMADHFLIHDLAVPSIKNVRPYFHNQIFYDYREYIKLSDNENPFGSDYAHYPDPEARLLQQKYAKYLDKQNLNAQNILFCNGSTEGIDLIIRSFCQPRKDSICVTSPTFGLFKHWADGYGMDVIDIPLSGSHYDQLSVKEIICVIQQIQLEVYWTETNC